MNIIKEIDLKSKEYAEQARRESKALSEEDIEEDEPQGFQTQGIFFGEAPPSRKASDYLQAALGWVYACVVAIADAIAGVELKL